MRALPCCRVAARVPIPEEDCHVRGNLNKKGTHHHRHDEGTRVGDDRDKERRAEMENERGAAMQWRQRAANKEFKRQAKEKGKDVRAKLSRHPSNGIIFILLPSPLRESSSLSLFFACVLPCTVLSLLTRFSLSFPAHAPRDRSLLTSHSRSRSRSSRSLAFARSSFLAIDRSLARSLARSLVRSFARKLSLAFCSRLLACMFPAPNHCIRVTPLAVRLRIDVCRLPFLARHRQPLKNSGFSTISASCIYECFVPF